MSQASRTVREQGPNPARALVADSARREPTGTRRPAVVAAAVTIIVALAVTALVAVSVRQAAHRSAEDQFGQSADQTAAAIESQVVEYFTKLGDISAFVSNSPPASPKEFDGFVRSTKAFSQLPSIAGLFYVARVEDAGYDLSLIHI